MPTLQLDRAPSSSMRGGARGSHFLIAGIVSIALGLITLIALSSATSALSATTVASLTIYGLLLAALFMTSPRFLCLGNLFGVFWTIWFPLRLLVIQSDRTNAALHPLVRAASDGELAVVWLVSLLGFAAFACSVLIVRRRRGSTRTTAAVPNLPRSTYIMIAIVGLAMSWVQVLTHVQSGIFGEAGNVFLLGIGGAAFLDARDRRWSWMVPMLVGAGAFLGVVTWFKGTAMTPILAWGIASVLGGLQLSRPKILATVMIALVAFAGVQGERLTASGDPFEGARAALFDYDLTTGLPSAQPNAAAAVANLLAGVMNRTAGADALLIVRAKTPAVVPFQGGRTLWQPAASIMPGARRFIDADLNQLSLGRFFSNRFWSVTPGQDFSSQAITLPGDLYLNFGLLGVALGMLMIGFLVSAIERRFPSGTALGAGVLGYVGLPLVTVDSNVAFALMTSGIRLVVVFALVGLLKLGGSRFRPLALRHTAHPARDISSPSSIQLATRGEPRTA